MKLPRAVARGLVPDGDIIRERCGPVAANLGEFCPRATHYFGLHGRESNARVTQNAFFRDIPLIRNRRCTAMIEYLLHLPYISYWLPAAAALVVAVPLIWLLAARRGAGY